MGGKRALANWLWFVASGLVLMSFACFAHSSIQGEQPEESALTHTLAAAAGSNGSRGRRLLHQGTLEGSPAVLAAGGAAADGYGMILQTQADDSEEAVYGHARALLDKKDNGGTGKNSIVGVHIKQIKAPKGSKAKKGSRLLRDRKGKLLLVKTQVSPRFKTYLAREEGFLQRVGYLGTIKRTELNAICKKVAKGRTKFKTDVNVDAAKGEPDTGDDIIGAKVDHQFGCTVSKGPKVELNPHLKAGVVFALLELGGTGNLIDCPAGVKKCNMWQLLNGKDAKELTKLYSKRGKGRKGRRLHWADSWKKAGQTFNDAKQSVSKVGQGITSASNSVKDSTSKLGQGLTSAGDSAKDTANKVGQSFTSISNDAKSSWSSVQNSYVVSGVLNPMVKLFTSKGSIYDV